MQIKSIILYNESWQKREIPFELNQVNIISGTHDTGKSAIIQIVEYCLGRSDFMVSGTVIRDTVVWYSVLYQIQSRQLFVAKRKPSGSNTRSSQVYYRIGEIDEKLSPPDELPGSLQKVSDIELIEIISGLLRGSFDPDAIDQSRLASPADTQVDKASYYLFQNQHTIAHPEQLFHRQGESEVSKIIKKTLLYFLGIEQENNLRTKQELAQAKSRLRQINRNVTDIEANTIELVRIGRELVDEGKNVGLLSSDFIFKDEDENNANVIAETLEDARQKWQSPSLDVPVLIDDRIPQLKQEEKELRDDFYQLDRQIKDKKLYRREIAGYSKVVDEQKTRLESINLFVTQDMFDEMDDSHICPLCHSDIPTSEAYIPKISDIRREFIRLETSQRAIEQDEPGLSEAIQTLEAELEQIRGQIRRKQVDIELLLREQRVADTIVEEIQQKNSRVERLIGRIEMFLSMVEMHSVAERDILRQKQTLTKKRVAELEAEIDEDAITNNLERIFYQLSQHMTQWARDLELTDGRYRLDMKKLTVIAEEGDRSLLMNQLGGKNYLGCHLITHLALHQIFAQQQTPVPRFLILDKPVQGYFADSKEIYETMGETAKGLAEDDRRGIRRMFDLLFEVCNNIPDFQIIILERPYLPDERFKEALIKDAPWSNQNRLIPESWKEDSPQLPFAGFSRR
ncbi:MAG: DUF3732 domain-containing protein [Deltaproteobacteria bacterium]|nr:DUF3732 domain-containing protein [Deltaproteobacteria bacterium]